jgi:DNA ligase (NAD+)
MGPKKSNNLQSSNLQNSVQNNNDVQNNLQNNLQNKYSNMIKDLLSAKDFLEYISKLSIEIIEQIINYAADKYYNTGDSIISDAYYDTLIDYLRLKNPKSKILKNIGAKVKTKNKVKLDYFLGSMDKIKPPSNKLDIFNKDYPPPYNLSDKLDGVSALLVYNNNIIKMYTRGTSVEGTDITALIKYIKNIPSYESIDNYVKKHNINGEKNLIAFRGELMIKESIFNKKWIKTMKNSRNSIAGLVNSKDINPEFAKDVSFIVYEVVDPFININKQLNICEDLKFEVVHNTNLNKSLSFEYLSEYFKKRRDSSEYNIDGIVITQCKNNKRTIDTNPDYAFAFKDILEDQIAITNVINIEWNISKYGKLIPTIIIEPVNIGGVEINRVTGHNAMNVIDHQIGVGAKIEIIRSGDVIPYINKVIKKSKPELPNKDIVGNYDWDENKVNFVLKNLNNKSVLIKTIYSFFSKLETKGLGEKNVEKMINSGLVSIPLILGASHEDLHKVEGFKEKTVTNILNSIKNACTNISLAKLMAASGQLGLGMGEERIILILDKYPNLMEIYKNWSDQEFIENIKQIDGFNDNLSSLFVNNFENFISFFNIISKYITLKKIEKIKVGKQKYIDKIFVFTGFRDKELEEYIVEQGGKITNSISKNTTFLVIKDKSLLNNPTEKIKKALSLNIKVITKEDIN